MGKCDGQGIAYTDETEQGSKCCFYLVTAPENTSSSAVVVVGDSVPLPQACGKLITLRSIRSYVSANTPLLEQGSLEAICSSQGTAGITSALSLRFKLLTQHKTTTQDGHKLPTQWPVSRHSSMQVIYDTPDLFISLTGTILTRIYSRTSGQLANHFIYMFLLSHLHTWTTACACGCTAITYIWLHSHKPSVKEFRICHGQIKTWMKPAI